MLGAVKPEPLDCRTMALRTGNGGCYMDEDMGVLDLRIIKEHQGRSVLSMGEGGGCSWGWWRGVEPVGPPPATSPSSASSAEEPSLGESPTLTITNKVLAAASQTGGKPTRPFKAYPKDPLTLSTSQNEAYVLFREQMLAQVRAGKTGKKRPASPPRSPPHQPTSSSEATSPGPANSSEDKDAAYWERRRKNNEAAKRSRDARRAKEDEIAIRAAFLEQENLKLRYQIAALTDETAKLRCMLYNS